MNDNRRLEPAWQSPAAETDHKRNSEYFKNYQREKREAVYKELEKLNSKLDKIEELINDKNSVELELQGENMELSFTDIRYFIKTVGEIAMNKYKRKIDNVPSLERQKYERLDLYNKIFTCLRW
jgi:hypothetical protein